MHFFKNNNGKMAIKMDTDLLMNHFDHFINMDPIFSEFWVDLKSAYNFYKLHESIIFTYSTFLLHNSEDHSFKLTVQTSIERSTQMQLYLTTVERLLIV